MTTVVPISKQGTLTLPLALRRKLGLGSVDQPLVVIEERDGELILRAAAEVPVRDLPQSLIEDWVAEDEEGMREFEAMEKRA
jgi:bifunctional DNA-binding transcriptional regulator/antitoxin component of YhaV-PrlF toxin-antitoxin module